MPKPTPFNQGAAATGGGTATLPDPCSIIPKAAIDAAVGEATAAVLIAELFDKHYRSARQAAAFAGVVPRVCESGTLKARGRLAKIGPGRLRKALYFPALTAGRWNPVLR